MIKAEIKNSLLEFSNGNLLQSSLKLFSILGYATKRQYAVSSLDDFKNRFLTEVFNEDKSLFSEWKDAQFLFQLGANDLNSEETTITTETVNNKVIESYLFFAIELKGESYTKKQLSDITREINKQGLIPAFILFKYADKLTFSIIDRRLNKKDDSKDVLEKVVLIKDIVFNNPHRAHIDILTDISFENIQAKFNVSNFVELHLNWLKALSITELNKKFYNELSNWFFWMMDTCQLSKDNDPQHNVMFGIRVVTRIIFNWFIKEKGLVNEKIFDKQTYLDLLKPEYKEQGDLYYKVVLQNLFFGCLSKPMDRRDFRSENVYQGKNSTYDVNNLFRYAKYLNNPQDIVNMFKDIPFLNGGLFECIDDKRNGKYIDCFTDNDSRNFLKISDDIFFLEEPITVDLSNHFEGNKNSKKAKVKGLFSILNSYKFTIDETTPVEEEIALDPELLGRIFENLLAAHNPETKTTARKSTGSYYTPREIVDYMCEQSLIQYLKNEIESLNIVDVDTKLEELLSYSDKHSFTDSEVDVLIKAVNNVKILDPACGSGAFPMGLLHKLVHILAKLDPHNLKWKQSQIEKASLIDDLEAREEAINIIEKQFNDNEMDYSRKLYLIQNCIFGVDIQPMATQISRLRFFISLIVDEKPNKSKPNMGVLALPNLETKFVAANTLIGLPANNLFSTYPEIVNLKTQLERVRESYFRANSSKKKIELQNKDQSIREQIKQTSVALGATFESAAKLAEWSPYDKDYSSEWFDPKWMFDVEKFDIVIGNPPYLEARSSNYTDEMKSSNLSSTEKRWHEKSKYFTRGCDLLIFFFELSLYLIKNNGINAFITQNSWLDTEYGKIFQKFLSTNTEILGIIDSDYKYFDDKEGPNINTVITFFKGKQNISNLLRFACYHMNFEENTISLNNLSSINNDLIVTYKEYNLLDSETEYMKWGTLLYSTKEFLNILKILFDKGIRVEEVKNVKIGQGLNISKSLIIDKLETQRHNIETNALIPFFTKQASFEINDIKTYLIDESKLNKEIINQLKSIGFCMYNSKKTSKKPPKLILPRGIGRHFCALNKINAYSDSCVDIYDDNNNLSDEQLLNMWCFLNSSIAWLLREISGRKNLGGGMLKAEAVDLKAIPILYNLNAQNDIVSIMKILNRREVFDTLTEIETEEHKKIDKIIFDYLELNDKERKYILDELKNKIINRSNKSKT